MNWKTVFALLLLAVAGCDKSEPKMYVFRLVRPDGTTHREYKLLACRRPNIRTISGHGQEIEGVNNQLPEAPIGWLWEIEPVAEKEDK